MTKIPVILDCSLESECALLLALASHDVIDLRGITTVEGCSVGQAHKKARQICEDAGRAEINVFKGCSRPFFTRHIPLERERDEKASQHAVNFITETLFKSSEKVTLVSTGPLTNIACALIKEPRLKEKIEKIVLMGGAIGFGNITPSAESNFYDDPQATYRVFVSHVPLVMIPLEITHKTQRLDDHGAHVIAYLLKPELYKGREVYVEIDVSSTLMAGRSTVDWYGKLGLKPNAYVINDVNDEGFFDLMTEKLQGYGEREDKKRCNLN